MEQLNTAYAQKNILPTVACGGDSVMLCGLRGNLTGVHYMQEVFNPVRVPHFDNHPLA